MNPLFERRRDVAIREAVRACAVRLGAGAHDREVAVQCATNARRAGASAAAAVERGHRYLVAVHGDRDGVA
jgi:hypothetical protein